MSSASPISARAKKPPPFLLGAGLLFWGWQTGLIIPAAVMAVVLEAARWKKTSWDFANEDFARIWIFCTVLLLAAAVFAFTSNEGPAEFRGLFQDPNLATERGATNATSRTAATLFRWLPMVFFLFVGAQHYSTRQGIPLETISLILQRRWRKARREGRPLPPSRTVDISYIYFALCLFAASVHVSEDQTFFWGACLLLGWALWPQRSRRFGLAVWVACFGGAIVLGYFGQRGMAELQNYLSRLDPQWWLGLSRQGFDPTRSQTALGHVDRLKQSGTIVIRLEVPEGPPPPLLREASYRSFKSKVWTADILETDFRRVQEEPPNSGVYVLLRGKTNSSRVNIASYLAGGKALLPLPSGTGRLENLFAWGLFDSELGTVLAEGPGLVVFDAFYGPGTTPDSPADSLADLDVPDREKRALDKVIAEIDEPSAKAHSLSAPPMNSEETVKALNRFFVSHFAYSTFEEPGPVKGQDTPLSRFLLRTRKGHCEYFATAGVLLLRRLGIPARYAVGYAVHEASGKNKFVVRERDAHAWCLVWDAAAGTWENADFTPASWVEVEAARASILQPLSDLWSWLRFQFFKIRYGQTHIRQYLLWAIVPVLLVLFYQVVFRRRSRSVRSGRPHDLAIHWPGLDSEFYLLERKLAERGLPRRASEPLTTWLERAVGDPSLADLKAPLRELLRLHYRYRFDPLGLTQQERAELSQAARQLGTHLSGFS